jgi:hypothetical protein
VSRDNRYQPKNKIETEVSLKGDREYLNSLREDIPASERKANDDLAEILSWMQNEDQAPYTAQSKFNTFMSRSRSDFTEKVKRERDNFNNSERKLKDDFLEEQKKKRDAFNRNRPDREEVRDFFKDQDLARQSFFADQRDKRKDFESEMTRIRSDFESSAREMRRMFDDKYREYVKRYNDNRKRKDLEKKSSSGRFKVVPSQTSDPDANYFRDPYTGPRSPIQPDEN